MENKPRNLGDASGAERPEWRVALFSAVGVTLALVISGAPAHAQAQPQQVPNMGQQITPLAPQGSQFGPMNLDLLGRPTWQVGQAVTTVVSPDHKTLLVLTSGYNRYFAANTSEGPRV